MSMLQRDWYDYLSYLRSGIKNTELQTPPSIGVAYNNFTAMQDIEDVLSNKIKKYAKT